MKLKLEVLSAEDHQDLIYTPQNHYINMAKRLTAPILVSEFVAAARCYPIIFSLSEGDEKLTPMALFGTEESKGNSAITEHGRWQENSMIPFSLESYPFYTGPLDEHGNITLLIDANAPHFHNESPAETGQRLFTASGEATSTLQTIRKKHLSYQKELGHTDWVVYKLYEHNLFQIKQISDFLPDEQASHINNFFVLDAKKLEELPDEYYLELRQQGMMTNIYSLIASQNNFSLLSRSLTSSDQPISSSWSPEVQNQQTPPEKPEPQKPVKQISTTTWLGLILLAVLLTYFANHTKEQPEPTHQPAKVATTVPDVVIVPDTTVKETIDPETKPTQPSPVQHEETEITAPNMSIETPDQEPDSDLSARDVPEEVVAAIQPVQEPTPATTEAPSNPQESVAVEPSPPVAKEVAPATIQPTEQIKVEEPTAVQTSAKLAQKEPVAEIVIYSDPLSVPKKRPESARKKPSPFGTRNDDSALKQQSTALGEEAKALIDGINRNITESRLSLPKGDNALEKVEELQKLNIDSPIIDELLNTVFERFLELAIWDRSGRAKIYMQKAEEILPGDPRIAEIKDLISKP
jgi:hypothetical protein